jgi:hypothetical protein
MKLDLPGPHPPCEPAGDGLGDSVHFRLVDVAGAISSAGRALAFLGDFPGIDQMEHSRPRPAKQLPGIITLPDADLNADRIFWQHGRDEQPRTAIKGMPEKPKHEIAPTKESHSFRLIALI